MDAGLSIELAALSSYKNINDLIELGNSDVQKFFNNKTIFITGGTGFVGKQLIEIIGRCCNVKRMYILIRPKKGKNINERLDKVLADPLFQSLLGRRPDFKSILFPIEGDITEIGLGIKEINKNIIIQEIDIIYHVAATVSFNPPLGSAIFTNVRGVREVINLAKECTNLMALVHVSTAYCHATINRSGSEILEQFYPCPIQPHIVIDLAENLEESRLDKIKEGLIDGWPNTYTFTKALSEELIRTSAGDLPVSIIRPTIVKFSCAHRIGTIVAHFIVISSRRGPCPGWVDISSAYGPSGFPLGTLMGVIHVLRTRPEIRIDCVPVDYVCNAAIAATTITNKHTVNIYHVGSSCRNYLTWRGLTDILNNKIRTTVVSDKAMWYCFAIQTTNKWVYLICQWLLHDLPAFILDGILLTMGRKQRFKKMYSTINKMLALLTFYTSNGWTFNDENTLKMYENLSEADKSIFHHDTKDLVWPEMLLIWYIGLRKYIVKDGLKNTYLGMKRQMYFKIITYSITAVFIAFIVYCILFIFKLFCF